MRSLQAFLRIFAQVLTSMSKWDKEAGGHILEWGHKLAPCRMQATSVLYYLFLLLGNL